MSAKMAEREEWRPGSFTKNFSWGDPAEGLRQLYEIIRVGFADTMEDVPRALFRERVADVHRPDYIAINFFLFNRISQGKDYIIADELVFQALNFPHSADFDKLGLFAFNLSLVGRWKGAAKFQSRPALWAQHYVADRVAQHFNWNTARISADDIQSFVQNDSRYRGETSRKLATNLNFLYLVGRLAELDDTKVQRWWTSALFLALDRLIEDRSMQQAEPSTSQYLAMLDRSRFHFISGRRSVEKDLATKHLLRLYDACGGRARFAEDEVKARQHILLPDLRWFANRDEPVGAIHPTNHRIVKIIPRACAMLAFYVAGFVSLDLDELGEMDVDDFIRSRTKEALESLRAAGVSPTMSVEDLMKLTRGR
jgi:hypothetical protein